MKFSLVSGLVILLSVVAIYGEDTLKLVIVGGYVSNKDTASSEVVDPTYPGRCKAVQPPSPYPFPVSGNTLQTFKLTQNTLLHISCGGLIHKPDGNLDYTDMCYTYHHVPKSSVHAEWKPIKMSQPRSSAASVMISMNEVWITGGTGSSNSLGTSDIFNNQTNEMKDGPSLPVDMAFHCMVKLSNNKVFIAGAPYGRYGTSYLVDVSKEPFVFEELPGPNTIRESPSCGAFFMKNGDGGMEESVIVMGGDHYVPPFSQSQDEKELKRVQHTSEIFSLESKRWMEGPDLPRGFSLGGCVTDFNSNTVILAGGFGDDQYNDHNDIISLDVENMEFITMPGKLNNAKHLFGMSHYVNGDICH